MHGRINGQPLVWPLLHKGSRQGALHRCSCSMPRVVLDDDQKKKAEAAGGSDLKYLFAKQEVSRENQQLFFHHGVVTVEKFASMAKDRDDLVNVLKDHWALDQNNSLDERIQVASIVCAHKHATSRSDKAAEYEAEFDVQDRAKPLVPSEWMIMRQALDKRYGPVEDRLVPSKEYLEKKTLRNRVRRISCGTAHGSCEQR